ncbi:MAG: DUF1761 domain-containing protein [Betaproteobacteria bacterium]
MHIHRYLAAIPAAVVFWIIGALWYGQLFTDAWLAGIGKTAEQLMLETKGSPLPYLIGFGAIFVMCCLLTWLIGRLEARTLAGGAKLGALCAIGFCAALLALNYGFEKRTVTLWLINAGYALVGLTVAGAIIGGWPRRKI